MVPPSCDIVIIVAMSVLLGCCNSKAPIANKIHGDIEVPGQQYFLQMMKYMINGFRNVKNRRMNKSINIELKNAENIILF